MIDPSKLIASATRIYGAHMDRLWGAFEPCAAHRVVTVEDGAEIACGRRTLVALHTPGHASHHIAFHDAERGTEFTGDVGGVWENDEGTPDSVRCALHRVTLSAFHSFTLSL
jgi:glyoxylase-like metal-dependent hydrolase (beta-lactamase superfamily II)